jgi:hypothetical protein
VDRGTVFVAVKGPTSVGMTNEYWVQLGHRLRGLLEAR